MILVLALVLLGWVVLLALVVGMLHVVTSSPTPRVTSSTACLALDQMMGTPKAA